MVCKNCGTNNDDSAVVCGTCGAQLESMTTVTDEGKNFAIASLVCGIVSFFCCGVILAPLAVIFGVIAKKRGSKSGMATAGIVLGVIGFVLWLILMVLNVGSAIAALGSF